MKENEFLDGVSNIDSDIVERFVSMDNRLKRKASKRTLWIRVGALAACFALIASIILSVISNIVPTDEPIPTWDTARYSASDIAKLFPPMMGAVATNAYTKVYVPEEKYLYINEIPDSKYLPIYEYTEQSKKFNKNEFKGFVNAIIPKLAKALGAQAPKYEIKKASLGDGFTVYEKLGLQTVSFYQFDNYSTAHLYCEKDEPIVLDSETIQIDQRLSDEEILASLDSVKNKLFEIFGVKFSNAKIVRDFYQSSTHGAHEIKIYFYNEGEHPLNNYRDWPYSDYIEISFDNPNTYPSGDAESSYILTESSISYRKHRIDVTKEYSHIANAKRISLEEAEELLYKGYVFGGHSCPLCMAAQDKISFDGYDFVDIEYISYPDKISSVIPFYAFYKKIEINIYGLTVYAKTYVPAIQVSGYEEYFESQAANHR